MRRELILALIRSAASQAWAIAPRYLDSFNASARALLAGAEPGGKRSADEWLAILDRPLEAPFGGVGSRTSDLYVDGALIKQAQAGGEPQAAISPATERATARRTGNVAVIPVRGLITPRVTIFDLIFGGGGTPPAWIVAQARAAMADDQIKAVVLDWDSPGGSVQGVQEAFDGLFSLRGEKPIVSQVSGVMASAAYWIGSAADEISASPSAMVGSLGVYQMHVDFSKALEEMGVVETYVYAGKNKVEGNDSEPLADEARAHIQEVVDDYYSMFMSAVAKGRGVPTSTARGEDFGQGRAYVAGRAKTRGLVDKVRTLGDTLAAYGVTGAAPAATRRNGSIALLQAELELDTHDDAQA